MFLSKFLLRHTVYQEGWIVKFSRLKIIIDHVSLIFSESMRQADKVLYIYLFKVLLRIDTMYI